MKLATGVPGLEPSRDPVADAPIAARVPPAPHGIPDVAAWQGSDAQLPRPRQSSTS